MNGTGDDHGEIHESAPFSGGAFLGSYGATDSSLDSIAAMKKSKNREAAKRSR